MLSTHAPYNHHGLNSMKSLALNYSLLKGNFVFQLDSNIITTIMMTAYVDK